MLKKLSVFILTASAMMGITASANPSYEIVDYETGEVRIYGECSADITNSFAAVEVLNPGVEAGSIPKELSGTDWQNYFAFKNQFILSDKVYEMYMYLSPLDGTVPYMANVNVNGKKYFFPMYFYSEESVNEFITRLNQLTTDSGAEVLAEATKGAEKYFSLNMSEVYKNLYDHITDKAEITKILIKDYNGTPIVKDEGENPYKSIIEAYERAIVVAAYNAGLSDKLITQSGELLYSDLLNVKGSKGDSAEYTYNLIVNDTTAEGRKKLVQMLCGSSFASTAELSEKFKNDAIYVAITYPVKYGSGVITNILNDENARAILAAAGWKKSVYNASNKASVANMLYNNPANNLSDMIEKLNEYANDYPANTGTGGGGSSGGGGGGGSSKNSIPSAGVVTGATTVQTTEVKPVFEDVPKGHWAEKSIMALYAKDVVSGVGENRFNPNDNVTREQFVKMLVVALGYTLSENDCEFEDVNQEHWYYPYVTTAVEKGIVRGISETEFGVGGLITREQIATMCYRAIGTKSLDAVATEEFKDQADVSEYALEAVVDMRRLGIISGNENGEFLPKNYATRAQAAQIIFGIINLN